MNRRDALTSALALITLPVAGQITSAPDPALAAVQGAWLGKLTYRDYSRPDRLVTLPTRLFVALSAPSELALHYVFDDGPGKTVYSYERMAFDFANNILVWTAGYPNGKMSQYRITSTQAREDGRTISFEREESSTISRYVLNLLPKTLSLGKDEGPSPDTLQFRNKYEFTRAQ